MQKLHWLASHIGNLDDCEKIINRFCWYLSAVETKDGKWHVMSGEAVIFTSDNREAVDAFLYGMGLGLNTFPPHIGKKLIADMKEWCDEITGA